MTHHRAPAIPTGVFLALALLSAGCQTSPAVTYVPPAQGIPTQRGIPISDIVTDIEKLLHDVSLRGGEKIRVAVIRYTTPSGTSRTFGRYLSQKIGERLSSDSGILLIDPGQVYEALHEMGIEQGLLDTKRLLEVGQKVGADVLVVGTYTDLGQTIDIQSRLVALPGAQQLGLFSRKIPKTGEVLNLIKVGP
jgi:hypothetical protein